MFFFCIAIHLKDVKEKEKINQIIYNMHYNYTDIFREKK